MFSYDRANLLWISPFTATGRTGLTKPASLLRGAEGMTNPLYITSLRVHAPYESWLHTCRSLGLVFPLYCLCLTHLDKIRVKISMNSY